MQNMNVEQAWHFIKENIQTTQTLFVPVRYINQNRTRPNPLPRDDTLHSLIKYKRYLFKAHKKYNTKKTLYDYNSARNKVSLKIKMLKCGKEKKIAKKHKA